MRIGNNDTSPSIQAVLIAGYRRMTPKGKIKRVNELTRAIQQLAIARIRHQSVDIPERELQMRLASLWLTRETMIRVFHWDPEKEGY